MKKGMMLGTLAVLSGALLAADLTPRDEVKNAAKALGDKANYSWHSTVENAGGGGGRGMAGPTDGKTEKDGYTYLTVTRGNNTTEIVLKGDKGAVKTADGWQSLADASQNNNGPGRFIARMAQNFKAPAAEASDLADKTTDIKKADDAYSGDLTEDGAKSLLAFGRRGGNAPTPTNTKGSVKFWIADGLLSKYQYNVQGTINFNG
ncbi:MAG: hypothetical protein JOZ57_15320, partial [Abitibacteriaceae bacterium]|nr:hypothetical protein [Abditibacteriaceae bacterium]